MKTSLIATVFTSVILMGCATGYQSQGLTGGFTEIQLDINVWKVNFVGNGYTSGERAEDFAMLRSAEIALANGFTHFAFISSRTNIDTSSITSPTTYYTTANANISGNNIAGNSTTTTYGGNTYFISKPTANNTVMMFKGKPNVNTMTYDANFICNSLGKKYEITCNSPRK